MTDYRKIEADIEQLVLPEGQLDHETVELSQRRRLFLALALECHRLGYEVVSVDRVADSAQLSKATLYDLFGSKEKLLRAALHEFQVEVKAEVTAAASRQERWTEAIGAAMTSMVEVIAADPALARLSFVEAAVLLPAGDNGETAELALLMDVIAAAAGSEDAPGQPISGLVRLATLGGMAAPIADRLMRGRSAEVRELADALVYFAINAHLGPEPALAAIR